MSKFWSSNWKQKQVGELCDVIDPHPSHRAPKEEPNGIYFLGIGDLKEDGEVIGGKARKVSPEIFDEHQEYYRITENTIGFCRVASVGKVIEFKPKYPFKITISPTLAIIEPKTIDRKFLACCLRSRGIADQVSSLSSGSTRESLGIKMLRELIVPVPPLPEQKKIAEILSGIEDSISKERQKIRVLLEIRRASLKNLTFGKGAQAQRIDSGTEFGLIPSHWTCEQIPNCCLIENSKRKPIKKEDRSQMRGNYPYHGATRIQDYISEFAYEGEYVLIGEDGDHFSKFDDWEMAQFASGRFNVSNHAHVIKGGDRCRAKWLFYSLLHRDLTLHLTRQGATRFKLSKASLECIPILVPPLSEQDKMISLFDSISSLIELRSKKVEKLNAAKAAIANDLLTGLRRVSI